MYQVSKPLPDFSNETAVRRVVILKAEPCIGGNLRNAVLELAPDASCIVVRTLAEARQLVAHGVPDLFVSGMGVMDGDPLDFLWRMLRASPAPRHVVVVTRHNNSWLRLALDGLSVGGILDTGSDAAGIYSLALRQVMSGRRYRSLSWLQRTEAPCSNDRVLHQLTPTERIVLAALSDGQDIGSAARVLGLSPTTITSSLKTLHSKLNVHHMGELVVRAAQMGFARHDPTCSIRVGFELLREQYLRCSQRPKQSVSVACRPSATASGS